MNIKCKRNELANTLNMVSSVVSTRSNKPVLQNIEIKGNSDKTITISGTDLEIGMSVTMAADKLTNPQSILVNAAKITGIINEDHSENVEINIEYEKLALKTDKGYFEFAVSHEVFPEIKKIENDNYISIESVKFKEAVNQTKFAISQSDGKYTFNGICVNIIDNSVDFVSSDGNRMSLVTCEIENKSNVSAFSLVICKGMTTLANICNSENKIDMAFNGNEMIARVGNINFYSRLLEGSFPQYKGIIPEKTLISITVNKQELLSGLRLINKICTEDAKVVNVDATNDKLILSGNSGIGGSGNYEIDAVIKGGDVYTAFNCTYFFEGVNSLKENEVILNFVEDTRPVLLKENSYKHMITPTNRF